MQAAVQALTPQMTENKKRVRLGGRVCGAGVEAWSGAGHARFHRRHLLAHPPTHPPTHPAPPPPSLWPQAEDLLREAMLLQAALDKAVPAAVLERLLPKRFKQYQKGISGRA